MRVDAHVASCPCQVFVFTIGNVLVSGRLNVFFSQTEVNYMDNVLLSCGMSTDEKVFWLDIAEDKMFGMHIFDSSQLNNEQN